MTADNDGAKPFDPRRHIVPPSTTDHELRSAMFLDAMQAVADLCANQMAGGALVEAEHMGSLIRILGAEARGIMLG